MDDWTTVLKLDNMWSRSANVVSRVASASTSKTGAAVAPVVAAGRVAEGSRAYNGATQVRAASTASSQVTKPSSPSVTPQYLSFPDFTPLPRPHGVHVATLHLRSHHVGPLDLYTTFALHSASSLKIPTANVASLPTTRALHTVLKSPFVHKKSQENFEIRTHRRAIKVFDADRDALDRWVRYLRRNSIGGVGMKVYVKEFVEFGWADKEMEAVEGAMRGRGAQDIEDAAKKIVQSIEAEGMENLEAPAQKGESEAPAPIS